VLAAFFLSAKRGKIAEAFINKTRCWYGFWLIKIKSNYMRAISLLVIACLVLFIVIFTLITILFVKY